MNPLQKKQYFSWAAVIAWMIVIFLFSAQTDRQSGSLSGGIVRWFVELLYGGFEKFSPQKQTRILELWHLLIRKGAHFTEYAILALLVANGLQVCGKLRWYLPVAISAVYALSDEIHQSFVPGRACRLLDVGIDTCGALFGMVLYFGVRYLRKHIKNTAP